MTSHTAQSALVVDVCGTLVHDDTTIGLLRHHFDRQPSATWRRRVLKATTTRRTLLWFMVAVAERLSGAHLLKHLLVRMLAGDAVESLQASARAYAEHLLRERKVEPVWHILLQEASERRVILASASLSPVVAALAESMGADFVSSELEVRDGRLTGRYLRDVTGSKIEALVGAFGEGALAGGYVAISDNFTDRDLLERAERAYVVLRQPKHRARWAGLAATFVNADK